MEENNLNPSPIQTESIVPPMPSKPKGGFVLIMLSLFLIILVGIIAFLGYQNWMLQKQINSLQVVPSPTPIANLSRDEVIRDWKTYTNSISGYSLKYLPTLKLVESTQLLGNDEISDTKWNFTSTNNIPNMRIIVYKTDSNFVKSIAPGGTQATIGGKAAIKNVTEGQTFTTNYKIIDAIYTYFIDLEATTKQELTQNEPLFDQILSTFEFLESASPSATPAAKACTMEAKLCPDGSYVGRTGPNCEFSPCPTP